MSTRQNGFADAFGVLKGHRSVKEKGSEANFGKNNRNFRQFLRLKSAFRYSFFREISETVSCARPASLRKKSVFK